MLVSTELPETKQQVKSAPQAVNHGNRSGDRNVARLASIGEMVATVAHESRSFLQRIGASTEMLELQLSSDEEAMVDLRRIREAHTGLGHLLGSLRDFAGPMKLDRQPCTLDAVWRAAWSQANPSDHEAILSEDTEPLPFSVYADEFRLAQVFRNLFENSRAACSDVLYVHIESRPLLQGGNPIVRIVVRDNGPGLTAEAQQRLFDPFYTTRQNGTGLGMTIAQRIIEQHGGEISLGESSGPGASFCITIPGGHARVRNAQDRDC